MKQSVIPKFPLGTFAVNVVGCLLAGLVVGFVMRLDWFAGDAGSLRLICMLGGFVTLSGFCAETLRLLRQAEYTVAIIYFSLGLVAGIGVFAIGMHVVHTVDVL